MVVTFKSLGLVYPGWRCKLTKRYPRAEVNVWAVYSLKRNLTFSIQEVKGVSKETLARFLKSQRKVLEYHIIPYSPPALKHIVAVWDSQKYITMKLLSLRCFPIKPVTIKNGVARWIIVCENVENLFSVIDAITKHKGYRLVYIETLKNLEEAPTLTKRQYLILKEAVKRGYYEYPRKVSLSELANTFKASPSTITKILRSAEKKILKSIIE